MIHLLCDMASPHGRVRRRANSEEASPYFGVMSTMAGSFVAARICRRGKYV